MRSSGVGDVFHVEHEETSCEASTFIAALAGKRVGLCDWVSTGALYVIPDARL